jgi:hypothetical protein
MMVCHSHAYQGGTFVSICGEKEGTHRSPYPRHDLDQPLHPRVGVSLLLLLLLLDALRNSHHGRSEPLAIHPLRSES